MSVSSRFDAAQQEVFAKVWVPPQSDFPRVKMAVAKITCVGECLI